MRKFGSSLKFVGVVVALGWMTGCTEAPPEPVQIVPAPVKQAVAPDAQVKPAGDGVEAQPAAPGFVYDPAGRRDPFESLITVKKSAGQALDVPKTPLEGFELGQLRLIGVIIGKGQPRAMVVAPDGKSYILTRGVKIGKNDGVVKDITNDAVKIEEQYVEFTGEVRKSIQMIQLPKREGV